ncbi:RNA-directed DNA polymerase, eukaryota, reverse transcriptase zinc-binding domain protein [Tanacetum coccineum]
MQNPNKVSDFRHIACCNVIYKCISKIVTNRIKGVLGKLVNKSQSAFIAGRQITDNILLAQELFKGYNRKHKFKRVAFKMDLQKAYDTINWGFLKVVLEQFGFPRKMVEWIMVCVSTTKFSININGEREGYFSGGRGLRQGDPMSPYLFILVIEVFSIIMGRNISRNKDFKYHHGCKNLQITHLCFADDLLVFCHGDIKSVSTIKESLEEFSSYSGLKANMNKSTIFFGGLTIAEQSIILDIIPFSIGRLPVRYLGVPLITKKICATDFLSTMQICWASVFLLPKNVIYEINKVLKGFLWCQGELTRGKAKVSWGSVCKPKEQGALCEIVSTREMYDAGMSINTIVAELTIINEGKWPEGWEIEYPILNLYKIPSLQEGRNDEIVWVDNAGHERVFGVKNGSERIKDHKRSGRKVECSVSKEE